MVIQLFILPDSRYAAVAASNMYGPQIRARVDLTTWALLKAVP